MELAQIILQEERAEPKREYGTDCYFVFPPISASERYGGRKLPEALGHLPPLGILYLAAMMEKNGFSCKVLDGPVSGMDATQAAEAVVAERPHIVCVSSITATFYRSIEVAKKIREELPDTPILIGGHHATIMPFEVMKEPCFDIIVYNEGELTFLELMNEFRKNPRLLEDKERLKEIKGIYFRANDGSIIKTEPREPIQNLDELPFAARHLVDMAKYKPLPNQYKRLPATNFVAIRGCLYGCTFCSNPAIFGHKIRAFSPRRTVDEIKFLGEKYGIKEISFWDDVFTINRKWTEEVCDLLISEKVDVTWSCYSRVNGIDPELLAKMKKAGCWNIFFGIESGNQESLNLIRKGTNLEIIRRAIKMCKKAGIETRGSFIIGLPGETPEMARKTVEFAKSLDLDYAQFCICTPFPGTEMFNTAEEYGTLNKEYDRYQIWSPVFVPKGYKDAKELEDMEKYAMRSFYLRPKYVIGRILSIRSFTDIKKYFEGLGFVMGFAKK
ncbi:MAG: radical SAM protein [archaeon]